MSNSGTIYTGYQNYTRFYLSWQVSKQDISGNRTLVNWQVGIQGTSGYTAYWYSNAIRVNSAHVNGPGSIASGTWSYKTLSGNQKIQLRSGSKWVGHNSDGGKNFGANVSGWLYNLGDRSASGSWSLPTIPRNSQVSTNGTQFQGLDEQVMIYTNRKSGSFTHTIRIRLNDSNGTILKTINSVGGGYTWTPSPAEITTMQNAIPNDNSLRLHVNSYNNQVKANSDTYIRMHLLDADPIFSTFTYKDTNTATAAITGSNQVMVKGQSALQVQVASTDKMTTQKGATPNKYDFQYDGTINPVAYSASTITSDFTPIASTGERTIIVRAYDSRLNSVLASQIVQVYDYKVPSIETSLERENNFGANTTIKISGKYDPLLIGAAKKNTLTTGSLQYRYKETGGSFGSWTTRTFTFDNDAGTFDNASFVVSLDNQKKFEFEFKIADKFGTVTSEDSVDVGIPIMFVGEKSGVGAIGINKMPENGALDVDGDIYSNGVKVTVGGGISAGSFIQTSNGSKVVTATGFDFVPKFLEFEAAFNLSASPGNQGSTSTGFYNVVADAYGVISTGVRVSSGGAGSYLSTSRCIRVVTINSSGGGGEGGQATVTATGSGTFTLNFANVDSNGLQVIWKAYG